MSLRFVLAADDHSRLVRSEPGRFDAIKTVVTQSQSHKFNHTYRHSILPHKISGARV